MKKLNSSLKMESEIKKYLLVQNGEIPVDYLIELRQYAWEFRKYSCPDALIAINGGSTWLYTGQKYDESKVTLIKGGWAHDHCEICYATISEGEATSEYEVEGYHSEFEWICKNCFTDFIQPMDLNSILKNHRIIEKSL
ncbi:hypothetical protein [Flagellimonas amoyensis]|uniref:hypothetical protein n=1 Tax=Flagellimonas amoyensis TaxID=2169401 RepID=UPI00131F477A|nr:hypothetical protein [Allomuricauda amoyensis]